MGTRKITDPVMWTHLFLLGGIWLWFQANIFAAIVLSVSTICSVAHHRYYESDKFLYRLDVALATCALVMTVMLVLPLVEVEDAVALLAIAIAAFFFKDLAKAVGTPDAYRLYHSIWHVLVAVGQCMLAALYLSSGVSRII